MDYTEARRGRKGRRGSLRRPAVRPSRAVAAIGPRVRRDQTFAPGAPAPSKKKLPSQTSPGVASKMGVRDPCLTTRHCTLYLANILLSLLPLRIRV